MIEDTEIRYFDGFEFKDVKFGKVEWKPEGGVIVRVYLVDLYC